MSLRLDNPVRIRGTAGLGGGIMVAVLFLFDEKSTDKEGRLCVSVVKRRTFRSDPRWVSASGLA